MANVRLTPQAISSAGIVPAYTGSLSVSDTYLVSNNGRVMLHFLKTAAVACVVTILTPDTVDGLAVADRTDTVPATTGDRMLSKFKPGVYNDANGDLSFTLDNIAGLSVAVVQN